MVTASRLDSPVLASKGKEKKGNLDASGWGHKGLDHSQPLSGQA
jgi:hypothetical protein